MGTENKKNVTKIFEIVKLEVYGIVSKKTTIGVLLML